MSELSFFEGVAPLSLATLAAEVAAPLPDAADPSRLFHGAAAMDRAGPRDVAAFAEGDNVEDLLATRAGACFVAARDVEHVPPHTIALIVERPLAALGRVAAVMQPSSIASGSIFERGGIDPAAVVHGEAQLEQGVVVDPGAVVGPRAEIGSASVIGANSVIGAGVRIGRGCTIDAQVSVRCALIGDRVTIHAGARIGLGAAASRDGLGSLGRVIIQDGVTIGANAVVERGRLGDTMIGDHACIGTLVVVGADTTIERGVSLAASPFPPSA